MYLKMNPLNRQWLYIGFHKTLADTFGKEEADQIWEEAGRICGFTGSVYANRIMITLFKVRAAGGTVPLF